uniref:Uncharacterized protein n=1 Tax=Fagus sylvatica TaxID=28930 RepID=A0A2N9FQD9_FAGSY
MARISAQRLGGLDFGLGASISAWLGRIMTRWFGSRLSGSEARILKWRTAVQSTGQRDRVADPVLRTTGRAAGQTRMVPARVARVRLGARDSERRNFERRVEALDLELGSSGDAVKGSQIFEAIGRAWERVQAWILIG